MADTVVGSIEGGSALRWFCSRMVPAVVSFRARLIRCWARATGDRARGRIHDVHSGFDQISITARLTQGK